MADVPQTTFDRSLLAATLADAARAAEDAATADPTERPDQTERPDRTDAGTEAPRSAPTAGAQSLLSALPRTAPIPPPSAPQGLALADQITAPARPTAARLLPGAASPDSPPRNAGLLGGAPAGLGAPLGGSRPLAVERDPEPAAEVRLPGRTPTAASGLLAAATAAPAPAPPAVPAPTSTPAPGPPSADAKPATPDAPAPSPASPAPEDAAVAAASAPATRPVIQPWKPADDDILPSAQARRSRRRAPSPARVADEPGRGRNLNVKLTLRRKAS